MKFIFSFLFIFISSLSFANESSILIVDIIEPEANDSSYLLLASDGLVYEIKDKQEELIERAYQAKNEFLPVEIGLTLGSHVKSMLNQSVIVRSIEFLSRETSESLDYTSNFTSALEGFSVSNLRNFSEAQRVFNTMETRTRRRSQCYNRAHVWSYELHRKSNINTGKMWLFFSAVYIREFKYKWWFHIAPYVKVQTEKELVILDREFSRKPQLLTEWKNYYMRNNADCMNIDRYSSYVNNNFREQCFLFPSSMYYWQPFNLENLEKTGQTKWGFDASELERAYRNAMRSSARP